MEENGLGPDELPVASAQAAKRARLVEEASSSAWPAAPARARPDSAAPGDLTVDDTDLLDCGICCLPLKPPIFQCKAGHVVCSKCRDKLIARGKCHVCGISTDGYGRCHDMERLLEKIRVIKCPNAAYGCTARPAYYDKHSHCRTCPHAPCHCPGEGCSFIGSTAALLDHFAGVHGWQCTTKLKTGDAKALSLHEGFNFLLVNLDADGGQDATITPTTSNQWLFLLNVVRQPLDRVISVVWIHPHAGVDDQGPSSEGMFCCLWYRKSCVVNNRHGGDKLVEHFQRSTYRVACTDLSDGLPNPDEYFQFVVPNSVVGDHEEDAIKVVVKITIKDLTTHVN